MASPQSVLKLALACVCVVMTVSLIILGGRLPKPREAALPVEQGADRMDAALVTEFIQNAAKLGDLQKQIDEARAALDAKKAKLQLEIERGKESQRIGGNLLQDIAAAAVDRESGEVKIKSMKDLLTANGITVTVKKDKPEPAPALPPVK